MIAPKPCYSKVNIPKLPSVLLAFSQSGTGDISNKPRTNTKGIDRHQ